MNNVTFSIVRRNTLSIITVFIIHLYPLYGTEFSNISTSDHINDNQLSYMMSSSNVRNAFIAPANARTQYDNS